MRSPEHEMSLFVEGFWKKNLSFDAAPVGADKYFQVILRPSWSLFFFIKITCCIFQGLVRPLWTWIIYLWNQRTSNFAFDRRGETNGHYHFLRVIVFVMMIIMIIFLVNGSNSGLFWGSKHHHPHPQQYNTIITIAVIFFLFRNGGDVGLFWGREQCRDSSYSTTTQTHWWGSSVLSPWRLSLLWQWLPPKWWVLQVMMIMMIKMMI